MPTARDRRQGCVRLTQADKRAETAQLLELLAKLKRSAAGAGEKP